MPETDRVLPCRGHAHPADRIDGERGIAPDDTDPIELEWLGHVSERCGTDVGDGATQPLGGDGELRRDEQLVGSGTCGDAGRHVDGVAVEVLADPRHRPVVGTGTDWERPDVTGHQDLAESFDRGRR